jgi:polysaccharide export outer membrane protein
MADVGFWCIMFYIIKKIFVLSALLMLVCCGCRTSLIGLKMSVNTYKVQTGDLIAIDVYKEPDISSNFEVDAKGCINHPLLGVVHIEGLTLEEVDKKIHDLLAKDYIVKPLVSVSVASSSGRPVMVFGEVRRPGSYELLAGKQHTLLQIIAQAGGFSNIAARDRVRIVRVIDGKKHTIKVKTSDLLRGRNGVRDINLMPGDVVTVPESIF